VIAHFLHGDTKQRRRVYRLVERGKLPHFMAVARMTKRIVVEDVSPLPHATYNSL
jgi:hypothetical protein